VPAGSMIFGLVAAANRDPAQVKEPEVFDVRRDQVCSLSFGADALLLGAYLALIQGEVLFPGCCAGSPACGRRVRRSTARPGPPCAAWTTCRCSWTPDPSGGGPILPPEARAGPRPHSMPNGPNVRQRKAAGMSGDVIVTVTLNAALHVDYAVARSAPRVPGRSPNPDTGQAAAA